MTLRGTLTDRRAGLIAERLRVLGNRCASSCSTALRPRQLPSRNWSAPSRRQQTVSQHLGILQRAGIVARHNEGTRVRYELVDPHIVPLLERADSAPCAPPRPTHRTDQARPLAWADSGWSTEDIPARPELRARPLGGR